MRAPRIFSGAGLRHRMAARSVLSRARRPAYEAVPGPARPAPRAGANGAEPRARSAPAQLRPGDGEKRPVIRDAAQPVLAAGREGDAGSGDEVLDGARYQDLGRSREGGDLGCDLDGEAGDVVAAQLDLAGMDTRPGRDAQLRRAVADGGSAADGPSGTIEGGQ